MLEKHVVIRSFVIPARSRPADGEPGT
jgi:hypothetical protein